MRKAIVFLLCSCFLLTLCSCNMNNELTTELTAMNTLISIRVFSSSQLKKEEVTELFIEEINCFDSLFDANSSKSDVGRLNNSAIGCEVSSETAEVIQKSIYANKLTDGAFDITVMPLLKLWGFDNGNYGVPKKSDIEKAIMYVDCDEISVSGNSVKKSKNTEISLGGIAKGYLGDKILQIAKENGISAVVSLGGNVVLCGENTEKGAWTVGVKNPLSTNELACTFRSKGNVSVVTSGGYERSFTKDGKTYHHIIDPKTGYPADTDLLSVTVIGEDGALCDALSTALLVMGEQKAVAFAEERNDFEFIFITNDNEIIATEGVSDLETVCDNFIIK